MEDMIIDFAGWFAGFVMLGFVTFAWMILALDSAVTKAMAEFEKLKAPTPEPTKPVEPTK